MDGVRFDRLTKHLATARSRRALLNGALGAALASAVGTAPHRAGAAVKRSPGEICRKDGECASGKCGPKDATGRQRCICVSAAHCPQPAGQGCRVATCTAGVCGVAGADVGQPCDDGDPCTENDTCQPNGVCSGTPKNCDDNNPCTIDSCNPQTGQCVYEVCVPGISCPPECN